MSLSKEVQIPNNVLIGNVSKNGTMASIYGKITPEVYRKLYGISKEYSYPDIKWSCEFINECVDLLPDFNEIRPHTLVLFSEEYTVEMNQNKVLGVIDLFTGVLHIVSENITFGKPGAVILVSLS